jgi:hypothetical protein
MNKRKQEYELQHEGGRIRLRMEKEMCREEENE